MEPKLYTISNMKGHDDTLTLLGLIYISDFEPEMVDRIAELKVEQEIQLEGQGLSIKRTR